MKFYYTSFAVLGAVCISVSADSATNANIKLTIRDERGLPVSDAVVMIYPAAGARNGVQSATATMAQRNLAFSPGTVIVAKGGTVSFPNFDRVRHSVYSFSKIARFEINLYGKDQTRSQKFAISGNVAVGCNIHDQMRGYIKIVDTAWAAKTDRNGNVTIGDLPSGHATVKVWHPLATVAKNESEHKISLAQGASERRFTLPVRRN